MSAHLIAAHAAASATGSQDLWLVSRASGLVLLVLFSAVMVLGVATRTRATTRRWPRFAVAELHRSLSLFAVALLGLHVATALLDPYVSIGWIAAVLPFTSHYETLALGAGTLAVDLGGAVLITSLLRSRLGLRTWRAVHYLAYLTWPVAFVHAILTHGRRDGGGGPADQAAQAGSGQRGARHRRHTAARGLGTPMTPQTSVIRLTVACGRDPARLPRLLPDGFGAGPMSLHDHLVRYGPPGPQARSRRRREELIAEVELAGLAGRGGAGFPTARKLAAVAARRHAIVVGNGTEGEPASAKDKVLMAQSPHLVLDGAAAAAYLVGAPEAIIAAHSAVSDIVSAAVWERRQARLDRVRLSVVPASDRFVGGEASAVVHWLERGIPRPKATVRRLSERGLHGRPTLVQNVETLAHLALITRYGAGWFRAVGTANEPGSMLVTLAGAAGIPASTR